MKSAKTTAKHTLLTDQFLVMALNHAALYEVPIMAKLVSQAHTEWVTREYETALGIMEQVMVRASTDEVLYLTERAMMAARAPRGRA